jgi:hypothetical protein
VCWKCALPIFLATLELSPMILATPEALPFTYNENAPLPGTLPSVPISDFMKLLRPDLPFLLRRILLGPPSPFSSPLTTALRTFPVSPDVTPIAREHKLLSHPDPVSLASLTSAVIALPSHYPPVFPTPAKSSKRIQKVPDMWTPYCVNRNTQRSPLSIHWAQKQKTEERTDC